MDFKATSQESPSEPLVLEPDEELNLRYKVFVVHGGNLHPGSHRDFTIYKNGWLSVGENQPRPLSDYGEYSLLDALQSGDEAMGNWLNSF